MSKQRSSIPIILLCAAFTALAAAVAQAQYVSAHIEIDTETKSALVRGALEEPKKNLSFLKQVIGAPDLGLRISDLAARDRAGKTLQLRRFDSTEFVAETAIGTFSYRVDLRPLAAPRSAAHASWLGEENGLLMLDDLLPRPAANGSSQAEVVLTTTQANWKVLTAENRVETNPYRVKDVSRAVFVLGKNLRDRPGQTDVSTAGTWHFSDAEVGAMADNIFNEYRRIFGGQPMDRPRVVLLPFPQANVPAGTWEAETRGSTVLLVSADTAFKGQSLQRLHEQLRHELFHLWLPNGVNLKGQYDWFYEGFALYQSLKTAVAMNQIRFDDFLDTLSRAFNIDRIQPVRRSLIAASNDRWNGAETQLYARGMAVAFLFDIAILQESGGKKSVETVFRQLYWTHKFPASPVDANEAVLKTLGNFPGAESIVGSYIKGDSSINPDRYLAPAGLENPTGAVRISLRVKEKPDGRQKALLDKLGYNSWRKLTRK